MQSRGRQAASACTTLPPPPPGRLAGPEAARPMASRSRLSKSRFTSGLQCHKQLWWKVHEPDAPELVPDPAQRAVFDQGTRVGEVARTYVPGGVLVDAPHNAFAQRLAMTKRLLDQRVPAIYEASFNAGDVYAAVDILERDGDRVRLIEVKSSTRIKAEHLPDVAVQLHVLRSSGLDVARRRADAPQPRVRLPGPLGPLRPRGRHRRGRGAAARAAGADRRPAAHARGRPAGRGDRRALPQALRVPVHEPMLGPGAGAPRQHALPRAARRRRPDRPGVRDDRGAARRRPQRHPGAPAAGGAGRPHDRRARARRGATRVRSRRSPSSTSRPSASPSRCGTAATLTRRCRCSSAATARRRTGRSPTTSGSPTAPATRAPSWRGRSSRPAAAPAPSSPTTPASSAAASSGSPTPCPSWRTTSSPSRRAWPTRCRSSARTSTTPTSTAASASSPCSPPSSPMSLRAVLPLPVIARSEATKQSRP